MRLKPWWIPCSGILHCRILRKSDEKLPEDGGSHKLPEEDNSENLSEGGDKKLSEEAPAGELVSLCTEEVLFLALNLIK